MRELIRALFIFLVLTLMTGLAYPLGITGLARLFFAEKASGSLVVDGGRVVGSSLIGQKFTAARYFHGRPSANDYDASNSGGTNFGPANAKYHRRGGGQGEEDAQGERPRSRGAGAGRPRPRLGKRTGPPYHHRGGPYPGAEGCRQPGSRARGRWQASSGRRPRAEYSGQEPKVNVLRLNMATDRLMQPGKGP